MKNSDAKASLFYTNFTIKYFFFPFLTTNVSLLIAIFLLTKIESSFIFSSLIVIDELLTNSLASLFDEHMPVLTRKSIIFK